RKIDGSLRVETIILTGIVFSSFLSALISLMITLTGEELRQIIGWLLGSVAMRSWEHVLIILLFFVIGSFILLLNVREINVILFDSSFLFFYVLYFDQNIIVYCYNRFLLLLCLYLFMT